MKADVWMRETDIDALMAYPARDLAYAQRFLDEGEYPKSINESYYSVFYAAKAGLLHLGVRSKNHQSVQAGVDSMVDSGHLPSEMKGTLALLLSRRNEAVYRYARRNWTEKEAADTLRLAERFVRLIRAVLA